MDLATLTHDLARAARPRARGDRRTPRARQISTRSRSSTSGKKGELTAVLRGIGSLPAEDRPRVGAVANEVRLALEAAIAERGTQLRGVALSAAPARGGRGRHDARPADPPRQPPPDRRDGPRDRRDLRPVRLRGVRGPRGRGRPHELPDAQHPARPPGARPLGHALRRRRGPPPADAHVAGPDPRHAVRRHRRSARCCPGAASATRPSTPATHRSSSRWKA